MPAEGSRIVAPKQNVRATSRVKRDLIESMVRVLTQNLVHVWDVATTKRAAQMQGTRRRDFWFAGGATRL